VTFVPSLLATLVHKDGSITAMNVSGVAVTVVHDTERIRSLDEHELASLKNALGVSATANQRLERP
jgi:hypothetical protein